MWSSPSDSMLRPRPYLVNRYEMGSTYSCGTLMLSSCQAMSDLHKNPGAETTRAMVSLVPEPALNPAA